MQERKIKIHFAPIWISGSFSIIYWAECRTILFPISQFTVKKISDCITHGSICEFKLFSLFYFFLAIITLCQLFYQILKTGSTNSPNLFFVYDCVAILRFLHSHLNFNTSCQFLPKIMLVFVLDYTEPRDQFEKKKPKL